MITRETRAICTACRFNKCVAVGMMPQPGRPEKASSEENDSNGRDVGAENVYDCEDVAIISDDER